MTKAKQTSTNEIDKDSGSTYSWLKTCPPSDTNFQVNLKKADAATIRAVLADIPIENNLARKKVLEARLRKLEKSAETKQPRKETISPDNVVAIETARIAPSNFEPQTRRRSKFKDADIESLAQSIKQHRLAQPIVVRSVFAPPDLPAFEIVFGERRFLAVKRMGGETINCFVRQLSDAEALELQYEENHRRQENDPLDDAFFFKFLKEKENYTDEQLADRLNTTRKNVADKLKLNDLITEAVSELNEAKLPLKHAYYLAKFPEAVQRQIVEKQLAYKYQDRTEAAASYSEFKEEVEENILRKLTSAPFDTTDERLHIKKLICGNCPERTGFAPALFVDLHKDDSCLNKSCFDLKTNAHLRLQRDSIAAARPNPMNAPLDEIAREVPLVTERKWADETPFREKPLTNQKFLPEPECEHSVSSLIVDGNRKGEKTFVCRNEACETHNPKPPVDENALKEKEEKFQRQVFALTREKVFAKSAAFFDDFKAVWMYADVVERIIVEFFFSVHIDVREMIIKIVSKDYKAAGIDCRNREQFEKFISALEARGQSQILFLLAFHSEGLYSNSSHDGLKKLAAGYARTDYKILDAEARLELAPTEFKADAALYLEAVLTGIPSPVPAFWWGFDDAPDDEPETAIQAAELSHSIH